MGLSSSTTKTTNTPSTQQVSAGNTLSSTFQQQLPRIQQYADQIGGLIPSMMGKYNAGDAGVNAARGYVTDTLGRTGGNPYLQQMIDQSGEDMARSINANLGTRGLTGGSVQQHILARELSKNALGMRYNDWTQGEQMKANAAGMAPSLAAADVIQLAPLLSAAQFAGGSPLNATSQYASGMGGLFGNTGTQTTTQSQSLGSILGGLAGTALSAWAGGGFKGV